MHAHRTLECPILTDGPDCRMPKDHRCFGQLSIYINIILNQHGVVPTYHNTPLSYKTSTLHENTADSFNL